MARRWARLFLSLFVLWVFVFVVAPLVQQLPPIKQIATFVRESGINASALYYTGVEETAHAETYLRNATEYSPGG
ncbi:MAG: hypothetical protein C4532_06720 [Candidatus Abyssobacteria bacterium SURF_17]|uniref:Uncharacterized protein n=1 Tax=Candidatus Abyssobacteria bacterium SURF_17 TaxID=2093361 RepID=A0A419F1P3_9BACT|nr:MAG: hypothetical protein C4532_06720 [Candidatus Abyssubacteria bacterium SURF_17]